MPSPHLLPCCTVGKQNIGTLSLGGSGTVNLRKFFSLLEKSPRAIFYRDPRISLTLLKAIPCGDVACYSLIANAESDTVNFTNHVAVKRKIQLEFSNNSLPSLHSFPNKSEGSWVINIHMFQKSLKKTQQTTEDTNQYILAKSNLPQK